MKIPQIVFYSLLLCAFYSCSKEKDDNNDNTTPEDTKALAVYNQAYQENYEPDNINFILETATNSYVLLDPYSDNTIISKIDKLKVNSNQVAAYISIGTGENWRADFNDLKPFLVSTSWDEWEGEYFVNKTTTGIIPIMKQRIDQLAAWGFDWVEFDNMDWIYDDELRATYNFQVTIAEGIAYYQELCDYAHSKGLKCMAKNTVEEALDFDGVLYESYNNDKNWWDTAGAISFLNAGKLVIINHYNESNCDQVYADYIDQYNNNLSFICEDTLLKTYVHYNE